MRRHLVLAALAVVACSKGETPADTTAAAPAPPPTPAITAADLAGTWDMKTMPMDKDTVVSTSELIATGTTEGWTMKVAGNTKAIPITSVTIGGDSVVTQSAEFNSVLRKGQKVAVHTIGHLKNGQLNGVVHARYANGDTATLRVLGIKRP